MFQLSDYNPYQAYEEGSVSSQHPMRLVVALYEGALEAVRSAALCLESGDILGRSKAINKALRILTELLVSLDYEKGGEISLSLKRLYGYMQARLLEAHAQQAAAPLREVEKLLTTLVEGWRAASDRLPHPATAHDEVATVGGAPEAESGGMPYAAYWSEPLETRSGAAFSF
jgi:flagellar protein FliS